MGKTRAADWITHQDQMLDRIIAFIDIVVPGERLVVAGSSFVLLDRAGHALSVEQKMLFRALVSEWLDRVEEYAHIVYNLKLQS
jgi:hypothetical protein